jgi:hypothetical protein
LRRPAAAGGASSAPGICETFARFVTTMPNTARGSASGLRITSTPSARACTTSAYSVRSTPFEVALDRRRLGPRPEVNWGPAACQYGPA